LAKKATLPPPSVGVTVAVKMTDWPTVEGLAEEDTAVVVEAGWTVIDSASVALWGVGELESVTWAVKLVVPGAPVGVPEMAPVEALRCSPGGRPPWETDQL
jgi:hypothetical protein